MGQFKPMVKMETTEPSVELKLAKGGAVKMKKGGSTTKAKKMAMGGGAMDMMAGTPALVGRPAVNAPVRSPMKPSMAMRRKAMMAKPAMPMGNPSMPAPMKKGGKANFEMSGKDVEKKGMPEGSKADMALDKKQMAKMKKGGMSCMAEGGKFDMAEDKAMIKKAFKQHDMQEHKGGKGTSLKLKKGGKMATGGVTNGQGGYATGGVVLGNGGGYKDGGMAMVEKNGKMVPDFAADGKGKMKKGGMMGGYATGGVVLGNGGGYKMGGKASKKAYATGGTVNSGRAVAMPQGNKPASAPVAISRLSGTYKSGGKVAPNNKSLQAFNNAEYAPTMRAVETDSNQRYGSPKRMNDGGTTSGQGSITDRERKTMQDLSKGAYDKTGKYNRELEDAMNPLSMMKELAGKAKDYFMPKGSDSVTKTKESVTVSPASKKRGGMVC
jgi:hypothetical protein